MPISRKTLHTKYIILIREINSTCNCLTIKLIKKLTLSPHTAAIGSAIGSTSSAVCTESLVSAIGTDSLTSAVCTASLASAISTDSSSSSAVCTESLASAIGTDSSSSSSSTS